MINSNKNVDKKIFLTYENGHKLPRPYYIAVVANGRDRCLTILKLNLEEK